MSTPSMREEFEAWAQKQGWLIEPHHADPKHYQSLSTDIAFSGFMAGASRVAPLVEGVGQPDSVHVAGAQDVGSASDESLLKDAAKAADIEIGWDARGPYRIIPGISGNDREWNPLTDDGDALRLAVRLDIHIMPRGYLRDGTPVVSAIGIDAFSQAVGTDREAATRRAIVRAAAAIASPIVERSDRAAHDRTTGGAHE